MPVQDYTDKEIRAGRSRADKALLAAVLTSQTMFCFAASNVLLLLVSVLAVAAAWQAARKNRKIFVGKITINLAVIALGLTMATMYLSGRQELVIALGEYVMLIQVCKIFDCRGNRDYVQMIVMSMLLALASSMLSQELVFAVLLLVYLVLMSNAAIVLTIKRCLEAGQTQPGSKSPPEPEPWPAWAVASRLAVVMVAILATAAAVFLIVPRSLGAEPVVVPGIVTQQAISGFSSTVRLGRPRNIYLSDRVVMLVRITSPSGRDGPAPSGVPYLRGESFDQYADSRWSRSQEPRPQPIAPIDGQSLRNCYRQEVSMVPSLLPVAFATYPALAVAADSATVYRTADLEYRLKLESRRDRLVRYTALVLSGDQAAVARVSSMAMRRRRLPWMTPRPAKPDVPPSVIQLARKWCADLIQQRNGTTGRQRDQLDLAIARRLVARLDERYQYTLDLTGANPARDGVEDFLFHLKRGNCEYFASAMTVMCQGLGIEARLSTGFAGGEYDSDSESYIFRQRDAHAWTEIYTPSNGWQVFDATPASRFEPPATTTAGRMWTWARDKWRDWEFAWFRNVIAYDDTDRQTLASSLEQSVMELGRWIRRTGRDICRGIIGLFAEGRISPTLLWFFLALAALALTIAGLLGLPRVLRLRRPRSARAAAPPKPPAFVVQLLKMLAKRGLRPEPSQTARQWGRQAVEQFHLPADEIDSLIDLYYRARFSGRAVPDDELARAETRVRKLRDFLST